MDPTANSFTYNHEYYLLKHVSGFVGPGARVLDTLSLNGYENQLAFVNPDGSVVLARPFVAVELYYRLTK